jgi:peptide-methionine (S)-S-oxide reductase
MLFSKSKREPSPSRTHFPATPERPFSVPAKHAVLGTPIEGPYPANLEVAYFGTGCFWGAEEIFWQIPRRLVDGRGLSGRHKP